MTLPATASLVASPPDVRKGYAFPEALEFTLGSARHITEAQPRRAEVKRPERHSLSAHQAAEPKT